VDVGEVAPAAAGDEDLFADAFGVIEHQDAAATLTGGDGGHEPRCTGAEDEGIACFFVMS
jgi:hypothetical protein